MPVVTITGNAWDHNEIVVPSALRPQLGFRPLRTGRASGLQTDREVWATLNLTTGAFSVKLEQGVDFIPFMRWLTDETQLNEMVMNRAFGYCQWRAITAYSSGDIDDQPNADGKSTDVWWVSRANPPTGFKGMWLYSDSSVTYNDLAEAIGDVRLVG